MTNTDITELKNLLNGAKSMQDLHTKTVNEAKKKIAEIRKFAIDAINDYNDVCNTLVNLINEYHILFPNPYIYNDKNNDCYLSSFNTCMKEYTYTSGTFFLYTDNFTSGISVHCTNINGVVTPNGYSGSNKIIDASNWIADKVSLADEKYCESCKNDLIKDTFTVKGLNGKYNYTVENLNKYHWDLNGWLSIKEKAEKTRIRTTMLVEYFKKCIKYHTKKIAEEVNTVEKRSIVQDYIKVEF